MANGNNTSDLIDLGPDPAQEQEDVIDLGDDPSSDTLALGQEQDTIDLGTEGDGVSGKTTPVVDLGEDVTEPQPTAQAEEEGDLFGLVDPESLGRVISAAMTGLQSFSETFVEEFPKGIAVAHDIMSGGGARREQEEILRLAEEEDISTAEATKRVIEDQSMLERVLGTGPDPEVKNSPAFQLGEEAGRMTKELFPNNPEFRDEIIAGWLPKMAGKLGAFVTGGALAGRGIQGASRVGAQNLSASALGSSSNGVAQYERALQEGASEDEAFNAFLGGMATGAFEGLPVAHAFKRVDDFTGGAVKESLKRGTVNTVRGVFEEGVQEGVTQTLNNLSAQQLYDETRGLFEDVGTSMAIGGALGGTLNAAVTALNTRVQEADTRQEAAEAAEAKDFIEQEVGRQAPEQLDEVLETPPPRADVGRIDPEEVSPEMKTFTIPEERGTLEYLKNKAMNWFSSRGSGRGEGVLPKSVNKALNRKKGRVKKELRRMQENTRQLGRALQEEYGEGTLTENVKTFFQGPRAANIPDQAFTAINEVLQGRRRLSILPESVQEPVVQMRNQIDRLSRRLLDEGVAEGPVRAKIKENIGVYLTRSYKKHDFEQWSNYLMKDPEGQDVFKQAVNFIETRFREKHGGPPEEVAGKSAINIARELMDSESAPVDIFRGRSEAAEGVDWGVLMKRGEIAPEIRSLMGEYQDGMVNYAKSIQKMATLLETTKFQERVRELGMQEGWLYDPRDSAIPEDARKITNDNSSVFHGLTNDDGNALWADKEVADAFDDTINSLANSRLYDTYVRANGVAKASLTIFNPTTYIKNAGGGVYMMLHNGHNPFSPQLAQSAKAVKQNLLYGEGPDTFTLERADELNLLGGGGRTGELQELMADIAPQADGSGFMDQIIPERGGGRSAFMSITRNVRRGAEKVGHVYQAIDDLFRLTFWRQEIDDHADALYDDAYENLSRQQQQEVEEIAAEKTLSNYQDYSSVPRAIRKLRRAPISNFASFTSEMIRVSFNTHRTAFQEIRSSNPKLRKMGRRRLLSALAVQSGLISSVMATAGGALAGISMTEQEEQDAREFAAPWDKHGALMPIGKQENLSGEANTYSFYNVSQIDPFSLWSDPIRAAINGESDQAVAARVGEAAWNHFSSFAELSLLTQKVNEVVNNETQGGGTVWQPSAGTGQKVASMVSHFADLYTPGAVDSASELYQGITLSGEGDPQEKLAEAVGLRITKIDPNEALTFEGLDFQRGVREDRQLFNSVKFDEEREPGELFEAMAQANSSYRERFETMQRKVDAAFRLGMSWEKIQEKLVDAGVAKKRVKQLRRGFPGDVVTTEDLLPEE